MARWSIDLIRKKMQHLGTIDAPTQKDAFEAAIKRFEIAPALQAKVTVTKISDKD
jgi:hypothetical protein